MDKEETDVASSGGSFVIKDPPQTGAGGEVRPRTRPKPKVKSQTVAGIALPGLAEVLSKRNISKGHVVSLIIVNKRQYCKARQTFVAHYVSVFGFEHIRGPT